MPPVRDSKGRFCKRSSRKPPPRRTISKPNVPAIASINGTRRIVEIDTLAKMLGQCSGKGCNQLQDLRNIVADSRSGFGSVLTIQCPCGALNKVKTCETQPSSQGRPLFTVNTKAAAGMIHSGMSYAALERFFTCLDIHPPSRSTLKSREREIGPILENFAQASCQEATILEKELVANTGDGLAELTAGYDMGWQRRSSGRSYNSRSGHGALIGEKSGLVLNYDTRISNCGQCQVNKKRGVVKDHDCRLNWGGGTSKAMESDLAVTLLKETQSKDHRVTTIIGDDDSTTQSKIGTQISFPVTKRSDINHARKNLGNDLFRLQKSYKVLTPKVIAYLQKCFSYAVSQSKGDSENCRTAILNVVPHVFGQHEGCGDWCRLDSDGSHVYKSLPNKSCLSGIALRNALDEVFKKHADNAGQLCNNSTSNPNESFNTMVASKAPKSHHYSKSESLDFRVASAVCQKNMGEGYLCGVFNTAGLPVSQLAVDRSCRKENNFRKRKIRASSKSYKRRRLELKQSRFETASNQSLREGITYESSVNLTPINDEDVEEIPEATHLAPIQTISKDIFIGANIIVFDLETTSLASDCDIVQISAMTLDRNFHFDQYIIPRKPFSVSASKVTGLSMYGGNLFLHGRPVSAVSISEGLSMFSKWLASFNTDTILVGHNIKAFDVKHLLRHADLNGVDLGRLVGFVDTLPLFKHKYQGLPSFSQENLFRRFVGGTYNGHNSLDDVIALLSLLEKTSSFNFFEEFSFSLEWSKKFVTYCQNKDANLATFQSLIASKALSKGMADKAASSGLKYHHLHLAYRRDGEGGLNSLFSEKFCGKVRVTSRANIISAVNSYFNNLAK